MNTRTAMLGLTSAVLIIAGAYGIYRMGLQQGMKMNTAPQPVGMAPATTALDDPSVWSMAESQEATRRHIDAGISAGDIDPQTGLKVLHYYDPMLPASKFDAPGKSPFMNMMLVPAYVTSKAGADTGTVEISARMQQNTGIRTTLVTEGSLAPVVSAVGVIAWNEREQAVMQARAQGFVERLHVRATLDAVVNGQALADLYVPDWVALQEEYLVLTRMQGNDLASLLEAAKSRMRQAGMNEEQIAVMAASGEVQRLVTLRSPLAGVISELGIREGMTVMPGMTLFRINGTGTVWAEAEVPESQAALLQVGNNVSAQTPSVPGTRFAGQIQALLPGLNAQLRTRKARLELANPDGVLVPGMLMQMDIRAAAQDQVLLIPSEAIIDTGSRTVVMVDEGAGRYRPVAVTTGIESGGQTAITSDLQAGQRVVLSGQFLLDSEASLRGLEARIPAAGEQAGEEP